MPLATDPHIIKTAVFEGPLHLLLDLIESRKLLINDISLSAVTDEYIARVNALGEMPLGEASEFVALAATLLLIKSRSLLPSLTLSEEEDRDIKELEYRLALYQIIKDASRDLGRSLTSPPLWPGVPLEPQPLFVPDASTTPAALLAAIRHLIEEFPKFAELPTVAVKKAISLEEMIDRLAARVSSAMRLSFREFTKQGTGAQNREREGQKREIVISFLALLELVKQGIIRATQHGEFGDIMLEHDAVSTPSYE